MNHEVITISSTNFTNESVFQPSNLYQWLIIHILPWNYVYVLLIHSKQL